MKATYLNATKVPRSTERIGHELISITSNHQHVYEGHIKVELPWQSVGCGSGKCERKIFGRCANDYRLLVILFLEYRQLCNILM